MAEAPGHLLGQFIGSFLEAAAEPELRALTDKHGLHLDMRGERPGLRTGKLLSLLDSNGNKHDLDFVIERSGRDGAPPVYVAFVECAWRRYTKHSKAKAQEIQGALLPLIETYRDVGPTPAAIVAGQWSRPSIRQLESSGFVVLALDFHRLVAVFLDHGIDISGKDAVEDAFWAAQVAVIRSLDVPQKAALIDQIRATYVEDFASFVADLEARIIRKVEAVVFMPLHGSMIELASIEDAITQVRDYQAAPRPPTFLRYDFCRALHQRRYHSRQLSIRTDGHRVSDEARLRCHGQKPAPSVDRCASPLVVAHGRRGAPCLRGARLARFRRLTPN